MHASSIIAAATNDLPSLPEKPHHPGNFSFRKRSFGKARPVKCSAKPQWFGSWPFLHVHYDECQDVVFCHPCIAAVNQTKLLFSKNIANAFVSN